MWSTASSSTPAWPSRWPTPPSRLTLMAARRLAVTCLPACVVALSLVLAGAAPAGASVSYLGFTWYADGTFQKFGPSGTTVTLYATGAHRNHPFRLYQSPFIPERDNELCGYSLTPVNPNVRVASATHGFIGLTSGV